MEYYPQCPGCGHSYFNLPKKTLKQTLAIKVFCHYCIEEGVNNKEDYERIRQEKYIQDEAYERAEQLKRDELRESGISLVKYGYG